MSDKTILKVERLTKTYPTAGGPLTVLRDVSFELEAGATIAIVGPSGSGKTTLLGLCAGLDQPTSGEVMVAGESIGDMSEDGRALMRNHNIGFVFQNFQLVPTLTALENVTVPIELRGEGGKTVMDAGRELLERVGLGDRADHYPVQLSGGEQQRVALARAFMNEPKILFCDEPVGNLDGETSAAMIDLILGLNHAMGTTLVLVTHDLELAKRCHRIMRLKGGLVISDEMMGPEDHSHHAPEPEIEAPPAPRPPTLVPPPSPPLAPPPPPPAPPPPAASTPPMKPKPLNPFRKNIEQA